MESSGERYVEVEHLLSWHVSTALRRVAVGPAPARGTAVSLLACAPEENHTLPLEALTAGLVQRGLPVRMFGAALPVEALEEAARRTGPAGIVLWSQGRSTASRPLAQRINSIEWGVRGARTAPAVLLMRPRLGGSPAGGRSTPHQPLRGARAALRAGRPLNRGRPGAAPEARTRRSRTGTA